MLASLVSTAIVGLFASCKDESIFTVTLDLGLDNRGSAGFGCTESPSETCSAILACVARPSTREALNSCMGAACLRNGVVDAQCARVNQCIRSDAGTSVDCYGATCGAQPLLIARATDGKGGADLHLWVDYIALGGTPGCRVAELIGWCTTHPCRPIRRSCLPIRIDAADMASPGAVAKAVADAFGAHRTLDTDAPDEPVLVRILGVAKSGPCTAEDEALATVPVEPVVGCAYSCPTVLSANRGVVTADLDLFGAKCTDEALVGCVKLFPGDAGL